MRSITVRAATVEDAPAIKAILDPIVAHGRMTAIEGPVLVEALVDYIRRGHAEGVALVADAGDALIGFQETLPDESDGAAGQIGTFVALDQRGLGIGRRLLVESETRARERGWSRLIATIRADNADAQAFYDAVAFKTVERKRGYITRDGLQIDAVVKEKRL